MNLVVIRNWQELSEHCQAIEALTSAAVEPNVFYEHWMLIPAMKELGADVDVRVVLIFGPDPIRKSAPPILYGLIPLELKPNLYKLPIRNYTSWKHRYCFLCTPLLRKNYEREVLTEFFAWLRNHEGQPALMQFKHISGDGPVYQALVDVMNLDGGASYVWETFNRAFLKPRDNGEQYIEAALSGRRRKEIRRQQRLLSEKGEVKVVSAESEANADQWIADFLELEASGWKGKSQTAFASNKADREFFQAFVREAFARGRLMMLAIRLDDKPIAMKCNLLAGEGSFAFKIGYDEELSQFSPGVLLELENIRALHQTPEVKWMDSCAEPIHFMINRLWLDRRTIQTVICSTGKLSGDLAILLLPWMKWLKNRFLKNKISEKDTTLEANQNTNE